jgi:hypothetical protein
MQFVSRRMMLVGLAALGSLWPGVGLADDDDQGEDDHGNGNGNGNGRGRVFAGATTMRLVPVSQVNGGTGGDFPANNPGTDALRSGVVSWAGGNNTAEVALRGAVANSGYDVQFERLNDHGREDLGTITTDGNGNFSGRTPNALGGNGQRVGTFVLNRGGQDQYVAVV